MEDRVRDLKVYKNTLLFIVTVLLIGLLSACGGTVPENSQNVVPGGNSGNQDPTHVHDFVETIIKAPTCTEPGVKGLKCNTCGEYFEEDMPATGHDMHITEQSESQCTEESRRVSVCSVCGFELVETLPPAYDSHDYVPEMITQPSCKQAGLIMYSCSRCNDSYFESVSKQPHDYQEVSPTKSVCSVCGQECSYPESLKFEGVKQLYENMRIQLIESMSKEELAKADPTMGMMWVDYSTFYDSTEERSTGMVIIVRAEYMRTDDKMLIDHERMFPFQLAVKDGSWYFINPGLVELK